MSESESKPTSKRDKAQEARRLKIIDAALTCFVENGYHQTGVRDIAKKAGVSLGNLYNYFPGKHDVLVAIAEMEREEMRPFLKILAGRGKATKVLDRFLTAYTKYLSDPAGVILTMEISSEAMRKPDLTDLFEENYTILVNALVAVLERGVDEGDFRPLPDTQAVAGHILDIMEGGGFRCVLEGVSLRKSISSIKDFVGAALRA